jgi:hypothetical protein
MISLSLIPAAFVAFAHMHCAFASQINVVFYKDFNFLGTSVSTVDYLNWQCRGSSSIKI